MPHDSNGQLLKAGDRVTMEFEIKSISENETACNVTLQSVTPPAAAAETYAPVVSCNSKFATKVAAFLIAIALALCTSTALAAPPGYVCNGTTCKYVGRPAKSPATRVAAPASCQSCASCSSGRWFPGKLLGRKK